MTYIFLLLASFTGAFAIGYTKFFGMTYLAESVYGNGSKTWVIQAVGSLMTLAPTIAYAVAGPLASSMRKHCVMAVGAVAAAAAVCVAAAMATGAPLAVWGGLFAVGFAMGIFSAGKMSAAPLEAEKGKLSIFGVNAGLSVAFLGGILSGAYFGTLAFEKIQLFGVVIAGSLFLLTAIWALPCRYSTETPRKFGESLSELGAETATLLLKYPFYLLSSPLLWGVAGASALAMTAYAEVSGLGGAAACSLMSLYAAVGTIAGNLASPPMAKRRLLWATGLSAVMAVMVAAMPATVILCAWAGIPPASAYYVAAGYLVILGFFFGAATNLIDSEYLWLVRTIGKEGTGAALQSAMVALFSFVVGGAVGVAIFEGWLSPASQFCLLSVLACMGVAGIVALALMAGELNGGIRPLFREFTRLLVSIRYDVRVEGLDRLPSPAKGLLILPNHPAEIDPVIVVTWLWPLCEPRPVVTERFFADKILAPMIKLTRAFPLPDMETGAGKYKSMRIERTLDEVIATLKGGGNVLMYPAGRLMTSGVERLGAASGVSKILRAAPEATVVLVSTRGLWGSTFSTALTGGGTPDFVGAFKAGARAVLRNLIFLTPRRVVTVSVTVPQDFPKNADPLEINRRLEAFYNAQGEEPLYAAPVDFWTKAPFRPTGSLREVAVCDITGVDPAIIEKVRRAMASMFQTTVDKVRPESRLSDDLGADSLSKAGIMVWLEEEYFASNVEIVDLRTVADVILAAAGAASHGATVHAAVATPPGWIEGSRQPVLPPSGATLQEAFLRCCDRMGSTNALADDIRGVLTWKQLKTAALVLAAAFRSLPGERLGLMLPASSGATICVIATLLAGKVPVMMNWTTGRRNLETAARLSGIVKVVTSGAFLDKLTIAEFGEVESMLVFLEDLRGGIGLPEKLTGYLASRRGASTLMKELGLEQVVPSDPAVILFTSGSEASPKGVPLSHRNILTNISACVEAMEFAGADVLLAILPPFHSFGFMGCVMAPLTAGLKASYFPNPTDGRRVAEACRKWQATVMIGTPTFIASALRASTDDMRTLRLIIVGAEKAPPTLYAAVKELGDGKVTLAEGYGITECAPCLTLNRPGDSPEGVGKPLPDVELLIVHPETQQPMPPGERGLVLARSPGVFAGYLGAGADPFIELGGARWYSTGDLGYLAPSGALVLSGRLKRFVKVAGEMVSLPAIEETLAAKWPPDENGPALAVKAFEQDGSRPELVLFSARHISIEDANETLKAAGFSNLSRVSRVVELEAIPALGSGKTDYQRLALPA